MILCLKEKWNIRRVSRGPATRPIGTRFHEAICYEEMKSRGNQEVSVVRKNVSLVVILCCPRGLWTLRFTAYLTQTWICFIGLQTWRFWPSISSIVRFLVFLHVFVWNYYTLGFSRLIFNGLRVSSKYLMRGKKRKLPCMFRLQRHCWVV